MKKIFKTLAYGILTITLLVFAYGIYLYQTNIFVQGMIHEDESKLFYYPTKDLESLDEFNASTYELIVNDSITIYTYHLKTKTKHKANVFLIHGAGGNATTYAALMKPLLNNGFSVYLSDWRGYGKSIGKPGYKAVLKDTETSFIDFINKTQKDSVKTIVYGMSLGGQLAIKITKDNQNKVDALVLEGSFESAQQIAIDYAPFEFIKRKHKNHPEKFNNVYIGSRDIQEINNTPKLIIHGINDQGVPIKHSENLFKNAKEPKIFWRNDTHHIMSLQEYPKETVKRINTLLLNQKRL